MARKNLTLILQKCDLCSFSSKNWYIYKRHRIRCRKEHGITKGKKGDIIVEATKDDRLQASGVSDIGETTLSADTHESGPELSSPESTSARYAGATSLPHDDAIARKPAPHVNRNYKCIKCDLRTNRSRVYLYHMVEVHNSKIDIYSCRDCEYCSQYRHKIQRHTKTAHKYDVQFNEIIPEYASAEKRRPQTVPKSPTSVPAAKPSGRKLMVKFSSQGKGSNSTARTQKNKKSPSSKLPSVGSSDQLSKVVEEIMGDDGILTFKCRECPYISDEKQKVAKHMVSWHVDIKHFNCTGCGYICFERNDFLAHRLTHRNEHQYKCEECTYSTDFRPNFERHLNNHRGCFPFKCSFCSYGCGSDAAIRRHMALNHERLPSVAKKLKMSAPKPVSTLSSIDQEQGFTDEKALSNLNPDDSSPAGHKYEEFTSDPNLQYQLSPSKTSLNPSLTTMVPRRTLPPPTTINKQISPMELSPIRKLPPNISKYVRHEGGKLVCPICNRKGYNRSSDLNRHMKRKHGCKLREYLESLPEGSIDLSDLSDMSAGNVSTDDIYEHCEDRDLDNLDYTDEKLLESDTHSGKEDESPMSASELQCKYCNYQAKWPSDFRRHLTVHSIEKRYKCTFCPKKYKYIGDMNLHIRRDHNKEPEDLKLVKVATIPRKKTSPAIFKCPCCPYTSAWKSEVDRHSRLHTGEKTFQCTKCDYQTYWRGDIRKHVYKHHPELMTDGVAINDIIVFRKDRTPEILGLDPADFQSEDASLDGSSASTFQPIPEYKTPESSPSKGDSSHESTPELNVNENFQRIESSPTPSPIKELGGGLYECQYCGFVANAPSKMNAHIATHTNLKRYMCPLCGRRANWKWDIAKHIKKDHDNDSLQVVKLSKEEAQATIQTYIEAHSVVRREHHLNSATEEPAAPESNTRFFKCSACDFSAGKRLSISRHIRYHHEGKNVDILNINRNSPGTPKDGVTSKTSKSPGSGAATPSDTLTPSKYLHLVDKTGPVLTAKPFMCSECGKRGATKGDIKKHFHYLHPDKEIRIIYLGESSQSVSADMADSVNVNSKPNPVLKTAVKRPKTELGIPGKNPKNSGYIKPFKCSLCGRRSNWRWDLSKHIRERHPGQDVDIIELSEKEARGSYQEYMESRYPHLKGTDILKKQQQKEHQHEEERGAKVRRLSEKAENTGNKTAFKRFKCTSCSYRSSWKIDVQRHMTRRHGINRGKVAVLDQKDADTTIDTYFNSSAPSEIIKPYAPDEQPSPKETGKKVVKMWMCSMCPFISDDKVQALRHLSQHNMKPFLCAKCNMTSNFRSAVYKHIRSKHPGDDSAVCKLALKLIKAKPGKEKSDASVTSATHDTGTTTETEAVKPGYIAVHCCKLCAFRSSWRSCVCRHIRTAHKLKEYNKNMMKKIIHAGTPKNKEDIVTPSKLTTKKSVIAKSPPSASGSDSDKVKHRPKNFFCTICPYKAYKRKMLKFHLMCHKPQPGVKQVKCKYCPYYVNRNRLLAQHTALHIQELKSTAPDTPTGYPLTPKKLIQPSSGSPISSKRHKCEKCPYTSNSKNDYLYHKQFHRPKPTADFKCDYCDYWVTHRRLIKQHMKVHQLDEGFVRPTPVPTPTKSEYSENSLVYDTIEIAAIKQRIIASKITPSISQAPIVSPMKIASSCFLGGKRGFLRKDGTYRKIHRCRKCPYMNIRLRNMKLHELMHGKRSSTHQLMKCPHCDYFVGSKGLLAHHLKVHQPDYGADFLMHDKDKSDDTVSEDSEVDVSTIPVQSKVDTLLEIARFKKYGCEKCPYASSKRMRFQRHVELHGSKQKYKCDFCDYSVPTTSLLNQHQRLHFQPNQNLLAAQSILNLQSLPDMPADVALASMLTNNDSKHPVSVTHDHIDLYENTNEDTEPKKIYRCDRCPYANIRRDHLLAHLRCHMIKNTCSCPYCDYSVGKIHVLMQHVKVHFSPLPELSEWLNENGDSDRIKEIKEKNMQEAMELAKLFQNDVQFDKGENSGNSVGNLEPIVEVDVYKTKLDLKDEKASTKQDDSDTKVDPIDVKSGDVKSDATMEENTGKQGKTDVNGSIESSSEDYQRYPKPGLKPDGTVDNGEDGTADGNRIDLNNSAADGTMPAEARTSQVETEGYVCQYCDRDFTTSDCLVRHEMQHLIGNSYEELVVQLLGASKSQMGIEAGPSGNHVDKAGLTSIKSKETIVISDESSQVDDKDETDTLKLSNSSKADEEEDMQIA